MRPEYEAIASAGFALQLDCPDLAMSRHTGFQDLTEAEFLARAELHVEALNHALRNVPAASVRMHICWGNYEGPHDHDIDLAKILPIVLKAKPQAILFEASNPRHQHEWTIWRDAALPDDKILVPGVLDTSTNYVEHPELVAQRLELYAGIVGREARGGGNGLRLRHLRRRRPRRSGDRLQEARRHGRRRRTRLFPPLAVSRVIIDLQRGVCAGAPGGLKGYSAATEPYASRAAHG